MTFKKLVILFVFLVMLSSFVFGFDSGVILEKCRFVSVDDLGNNGPEVIIRYSQVADLVLIYYLEGIKVETGDINAYLRADEARRISENQYSFVKDGINYYINKELPDVCYYDKSLESEKVEENTLDCSSFNKEECENSQNCYVEIIQEKKRGIFGSPISPETFECVPNLQGLEKECVDQGGISCSSCCQDALFASNEFVCCKTDECYESYEQRGYLYSQIDLNFDSNKEVTLRKNYIGENKDEYRLEFTRVDGIKITRTVERSDIEMIENNCEFYSPDIYKCITYENCAGDEFCIDNYCVDQNNLRCRFNEQCNDNNGNTYDYCNKVQGDMIKNYCVNKELGTCNKNLRDECLEEKPLYCGINERIGLFSGISVRYEYTIEYNCKKCGCSSESMLCMITRECVPDDGFYLIQNEISPEGGVIATIFNFDLEFIDNIYNTDKVWVEVYDVDNNHITSFDLNFREESFVSLRSDNEGDIDPRLYHPQNEVALSYNGVLDSSNIPVGIYKVKYYRKTKNTGQIILFDTKYIKVFGASSFISRCIDLLGSNNPSVSRANIIFLAFGYPSIESAKEESLKQINTLFNLEPFRSDKGRFNVWLVNYVGDLSKCARSERSAGFFVDCPLDLVYQYCPFGNSFYNLLIGEEFRSHASGDVTMLSQTSLSEPHLLAHEMGHSFGKLSDEYIDESDESKPIEIVDYLSNIISNINSNCFFSPNMPDVGSCLNNAPWKSRLGDGCGEPGVIDCTPSDQLYNVEVNCFEGCKHMEKEMYRSGYNTIMNNFKPPYLYGPWNEYLIKQKIDEYSGD